MAEMADVLVHGAGERDGFMQDRENVVRGEVLLGVERVEKRADDGFFDFSATEIFAGFREEGDIKLFGVATAAGQVDAEDFRALFLGRKVHEKDFVEATLSQELGRQLRDIVSGRDDEY